MKSENLNKKATKAGIWYTFANILLKGCAFLSLPIFTRILNPNDFGIYNSYIAYEGIITAILGLGLYGTVKNAKLDFKENFDEYLSSVLSLSLIVLIIVFIIVNILYPIYSSFLGFNRLLVNCLIFQSFGSYLVYFYGSKLNIEFKYKSYIFLSFFNTIGNILLSIILIIFIFPNERFYGRIIGSAIPLIVIGIIISVLILFKGKKIYSSKYWKYALLIGLPLVPHVISQSLLSQFDRIMINNIDSSSSSGIYSYIYTICTITYVICTSMDNAWTPWIYHKLNDNKGFEIENASKKYIKLFALLTLGFICVMPEFTRLIAEKSYWDGIDLIVPLALSNYFIFLYLLPVGIEYYYKKTKYISIGTVSAAVLNLILNYIFISTFGYKAAAYTTLASYMILFLFHWIIYKNYSKDKVYSLKYIIIVSSYLMFFSFIILLVNNLWKYSIYIRYFVVIILIYELFKLKNDILSIFRGEK